MSNERKVESIILVYNADWSLRGAVDYLVDRLRGTEDCALCEITHRFVFEKSQWNSCTAELGVPVEVLYRNKLDKDLEEVIQGDFPAVLARTKRGYIKLLGRAALESCAGDPQKLFAQLQRSRAEQGLS